MGCSRITDISRQSMLSISILQSTPLMLWRMCEHHRQFLIGSLVYTRANRLIAMSAYNTETKALFYTLLEEVNYGQMIDVHLSHIPTVHDKSIIERKDKLKSGNYTFLRPILLGAASAQALNNEAFSTLWSTLGTRVSDEGRPPRCDRLPKQ